MPNTQIAPLDHAARQFHQNCLFEFDGAIFLSTPTLLSEAQVIEMVENSVPLFFDVNGLPVMLKHERVSEFVSQCRTKLVDAAATYATQSKAAHNQFLTLLAIEDIPDEQAE